MPVTLMQRTARGLAGAVCYVVGMTGFVTIIVTPFAIGLAVGTWVYRVLT